MGIGVSHFIILIKIHEFPNEMIYTPSLPTELFGF